MGSQRMQTQLIHADDYLALTTDIAPPLHPSSNFHYPTDSSLLLSASEKSARLNKRNDDDIIKAGDGAIDIQDTEAAQQDYVYSREHRPTTTRVESVLSELLEGIEVLSSRSTIGNLNRTQVMQSRIAREWLRSMPSWYTCTHPRWRSDKHTTGHTGY